MAKTDLLARLRDAHNYVSSMREKEWRAERYATAAYWEPYVELLWDAIKEIEDARYRLPLMQEMLTRRIFEADGKIIIERKENDK
jgi:hypothetical protein